MDRNLGLSRMEMGLTETISADRHPGTDRQLGSSTQASSGSMQHCAVQSEGLSATGLSITGEMLQESCGIDQQESSSTHGRARYPISARTSPASAEAPTITTKYEADQRENLPGTNVPSIGQGSTNSVPSASWAGSTASGSGSL